MKFLISWCHDDCTYSLLKILSLIPNAEIYIPSKPIDGFITFLLDYNKWPIKNFKKIVKPLESLKSLDLIDVYIAEIVSVIRKSDGSFTDVQVDWGVKNVGINKTLVYSYNVVGMDKFLYRDQMPLLSSSKVSYQSYGAAPKHFIYAEPPMLNYSNPHFTNRLILIQNSYEIQKASVSLFKQILVDQRFFTDFEIRYYGFTDEPNLREINYRGGNRIGRDEINRIIIKEMTFSLHLKDHEGYGYNPLKCMYAGRPVINKRESVKHMTYELTLRASV